MDTAAEQPGGQGAGPDSDGSSFDGELTRSDLDLIRQAAANDWSVPPATARRVMARVVAYLDPTTDEGASAPDRVVLGAARALAAFLGVGLKQQQIDLMRERIEGKKSEVDLASLVEEAEHRAEARKREREKA